MKDAWYQAGIRVVPHVLIERADHFLLMRQASTGEIKGRVVHGKRDAADAQRLSSSAFEATTVLAVAKKGDGSSVTCSD